jgi:hypothetical protein
MSKATTQFHSQAFGTILITKDRNWCLERTVKALDRSELVSYPIVVVNNGSTREDPLDALKAITFTFDYIRLPHNVGIVGARIYAHRVAECRGWRRAVVRPCRVEARPRGPASPTGFWCKLKKLALWR